MSENLVNVLSHKSSVQTSVSCVEGKMEENSSEKAQENLVEEKKNCEENSNSNSLSDCQNSSETMTNELENHKSEIKVLANSLEKNLTLNHSVNSLPNGVTHDCDNDEIEYVSYKSELQMPDIMRLIQKDLSEPYSIYTYRYFIHNWPKLCFLAIHNGECVGAVVCKLDVHRKVIRRGYIAMLAVDQKYRKRKIGSNLVLKAIRAMSADNADEVVLETEITNRPALKLYENLGFVRDKRLFRYYLNGVDALRLKLCGKTNIEVICIQGYNGKLVDKKAT